MASDRPYTVLEVHCDVVTLRRALSRVLEDQKLHPAPGLSLTREEAGRDPHDRDRRFFRLRPVRDGAATQVVELGGDDGADYFLATTLGAMARADVTYAALSPTKADGVVLRTEGGRTRELWLAGGQPDPEESTLSLGDRTVDELLESWQAPADAPRFEDGDEEVLGFCRQGFGIDDAGS